MELKTVKVEKPETTNFILGQSHSQIRFGVGFCESSGPALVRFTGNDAALIELAKKNALALSCGHCFILFMENGFPVNILNIIKSIPEVCNIYCATANSVEVIVAESNQGRGILGVIDGIKTQGIETAPDIQARKDFLRKIGYKL
jgi:hypothetical protein